MLKQDFNIGDRIYYTGDMANDSAWLIVSSTTHPTGALELKHAEDESAWGFVHPVMIGDFYQGHCNPRFVTAKAYTTYYENRLATFRNRAA